MRRLISVTLTLVGGARYGESIDLFFKLGPGFGRSGRHHPPDALTRLTVMLDEDLQATNRAIVARMDSPVALIPQLAAHLVAAGGKRLRPLLTLASGKTVRLSGRPACGIGRLR